MAKVLFVGDIVGPEAARWVAARLPTLREQYELDWVVANGENCAVTGPNPMDGFGLTLEIADVLLAAGVDAITGGNHSWDGPDVDRVLRYPEVVRPVNVDECLGQGVVTLKDCSHELTVVNLLSPTAALPGMRAPQPHPIWPSWSNCAQGRHYPARLPSTSTASPLGRRRRSRLPSTGRSPRCWAPTPTTRPFAGTCFPAVPDMSPRWE